LCYRLTYPRIDSSIYEQAKIEDNWWSVFSTYAAWGKALAVPIRTEWQKRPQTSWLCLLELELPQLIAGVVGANMSGAGGLGLQNETVALN
jgi:hypothetical protein